LETNARAALALEVGEELPVSRYQDTGAVDKEGDLVIAVALADEEDDPRERGEIVFDGGQAMVKPVRDLVGLLPLQEQPHRLGAMRLAGSDVLLLAARGHLDAPSAQDLDVAHDGAQATIEQAESEIFVGEEAVLLAGL